MSNWVEPQLTLRTRASWRGDLRRGDLRGRVARGLALICLVFGIYGLVPVLGPSLAQTPDIAPANTTPAGTDGASSDGPRVALVLTFRGAVTPVLDRYLQAAIEQGQALDAELIVLQLDTPGGSVDVTRAINQRILAAPLPIAVYVAPSGANAGSAGTFITLAGHLAVMAPGTSIGAASPVGASGEDIGDTMEAKITNILSADIENLAERRGDAAVEWAIAAVEEAATATASQALELGIIDFIAPTVADLLAQAHGMEMQVQGQPRTLNTAAAQIETLELTGIEQFLNFIANPTIASLLLSLGLLGLFVEIRTPGVGLPGIIGALSLLLALYALGQLDANFAGFALMVLALILFVAEAFTPTFGLFTVGGAIAFVIGGALLFDSTALPVPWTTLISLAVFMGGLTLFAGIKALAAQRRPVTTGGEGLIGQVVTLRTSLDADTDGRVFISGEWWNARLDQGTLAAGAQVRVIGREGYLLLVVAVDAARTSDD
ncbi:MAG: nodulation protein NfeD [Litorilinea sp.]